MKKSKISVIIPMYNVEEYLSECLDSIVNQDYGLDNIEVIMIDDGSSDKTIDVAKKYVDKYDFILLRNLNNSGQAISRNKGIKEATGEYVVFLDSDDMLYKSALTTLYEEVIETDSDMVIARLNSFDSKGEYGYYSDKYINEHKITNIYENNDLINCISICSKIYKTDIIKNIEFLPKTFHEDNSFTISVLFAASKIAVIPEYLYYRRYREGENKSTMQKLDYKTFNDLILNYKEILRNIKPKQKIDFLYKYMVKKLNNYLIKSVKKENYKDGKKAIKNFIADLEISNTDKMKLRLYKNAYYLVAKSYMLIKK